MARKSRFSSGLAVRKGMPLILAVCWFGGLLCGVFSYTISSPEIVALMHRAVSCSASIVGLLNAALIPFLLSAFFIFFSMPWMVAGICFAKAFLFSFISMGFLTGFGSGGWLLRYFLLFSDCAAMPLLCWYWFRYVSAPVRLRWIAISALLFFVLALITALDYRVIAPFVCR